MNEILYKILIEPHTGRILIVYQLSDPRVKLTDTTNIVDITNHPMRDQIVKEPHMHKFMPHQRWNNFIKLKKPFGQ